MTEIDFQKLSKTGKAIITSDYAPLQRKLSELKSLFSLSFDFTNDLESKIDQYSLCVAAKPEELALPKLKTSKFTPLLYACTLEEKKSLVGCDNSETLDEKINKFSQENNIYSFIDIKSPAFEIKSVLLSCLSDRIELIEKLQKLPQSIRRELLETDYSLSSFKNLLEEVRMIEREQKFFEDDAKLVHLLVDYTNKSTDFSRELAAAQAIKVIKQYDVGERHGSRLGGGLSSEPGSTNRLGNIAQGTAYTHALRWRIFRLVENDRSGNNHFDIATQRYNDAFALRDNKNFRTPLMTKPIDLNTEDPSRNQSFILMQEVEGPTLNDVLRKIQTEVNSIEEKLDKKDTASVKRFKQLSALRSELVNKYARDIAVWQNAELKTFVKKPNGKEIVEEYKKRISTLPDIFDVIAPGLFDFDVEGIAYLDSINLLEQLDVSAKNIVRIRDPSLPNAALQFDRVRYDNNGQVEFTMADLDRVLLIPGKENGNAINKEKIEGIFYNLDLHYRYGHIFEDLAHLTTEAECAFLVHGERGFNVKGVRRLFYDFVETIKRPDLRDDELSVYLMLNYRSQRKLGLYASTFAFNSMRDYERGNITKQRLDRRLKMFERNVKNHAQSCGFLSGRLRTMAAAKCENKQERSHVAKWYKEAKISYGPLAAQQYQSEVKNLEDSYARAYWHACISELTNEKLVHYLNKKPLYFDKLKDANKTRLL